MVLTQAEMKRQKEIKIEVAPYNPKRRFMSKAEVLEEKRITAEKKAKLAAYSKQLDKEAEKSNPQPQVSQAAADEKQKRIERLKAQIENERGPGSKARKAKLQEEVDALEKE